MDIMHRIQALPQEIVDEIFSQVLLQERPPYQPYSRTEGNGYTTLVPGTKTTLSALVSHMLEVLANHECPGLDWEQATYYVARLFKTYGIFRHIPKEFFLEHLSRYCGRWQGSRWREYSCGILEAAGFLRLKMLADECSKARGDWQGPAHFYHNHFKSDVVVLSELCFEELPTFLWHTVGAVMTGDWIDDQEWFLKISDGKVRALYVADWDQDSTHWLKREGEPWVSTKKFATIKSYDEDGRGGVMEWSLECGHYEIEFDNCRSTNIDHYLCTFDEAGVSKANQARSDADLAKWEKIERLRGATVAAMSKEERLKRTAREGRFWCLA